MAINLSDILTFDKAITLMIFFPVPVPNAIKVVTSNGKKIKFTVNKRKGWLQNINEIINNTYKSEIGGKALMKKPIYKRWWFIAIGIVIILGAIGASQSE